MTIKVPRRLVWQLDRQIKAEKARLAKLQARLQELIEARAQMEPMDTNSTQSMGGVARAESMSPSERSTQARKAAQARWNRGDKE